MTTVINMEENLFITGYKGIKISGRLPLSGIPSEPAIRLSWQVRLYITEGMSEFRKVLQNAADAVAYYTHYFFNHVSLLLYRVNLINDVLVPGCQDISPEL